MLSYKDHEPVNRQFLVSIRKFKTSEGSKHSALRFSMSNRKSIEWVLSSDEEVDAIYTKCINEFAPIELTYEGGQ